MQAASGRKANSLIDETSPYLLQHAYNPVDWLPFSPEAFERAKLENKLVLVSVGYSACHWCHVMERESFEDPEVAALMNSGFICIKVDREERADVDMLYMQAVQLMTGQGGWPLNCFVLPDGRPFYGGTYFHKTQWMHVLNTLAELHRNDPGKIENYAGELTRGIRQAEDIVTSRAPSETDKALLRRSVSRWKERLDPVNGGPNRAPKFPLPNNYKFLLRYATVEDDHELLDHVELTLTKMAFGGIYDQLHGGFARYSTDMLWKVPHFEKMLYDNAQLASLYAEAFSLTGNPLYKQTALGVLAFVEREWLKPEGCFLSAYDADSEGEEGRYYVWNADDLAELLGNDFAVFSDYFQVNSTGYWEQGNYILMRADNSAAIAASHGLSLAELQSRIDTCLDKLREAAALREKPGLDDKSITSWNAMMCSAYATAYLAFGQPRHKEIALLNLEFIRKKLSLENGRLLRTYKNGRAKIEAFLDDYAFVIEAAMNCYLLNQDESLLRYAESLCELTLELFKHPQSELLFYTAGNDLLAKTVEVSDNVIPASNSQMALNLFYLGVYFDRAGWKERAGRMLDLISEDLSAYAAGYSNWGCLALHLYYPFRELAIVGNNVNENLLGLYQTGLTNTILAVHAQASELPLLKDRYVPGQTLIYVCENNTCQLPVNSVADAAKLLA